MPPSRPQRSTVTYKVGSRHEHYGETGMAHLSEHLALKSTPGLPGKTIVQEFARRGAVQWLHLL
ncbi:MAG: insulinase family protein [Uliginosibacterium sp.]|nr:insulinase family protein [Uliginosibacterium sp.]